MGRRAKNHPRSDAIHEEALRIARGTQRPGQTREQTRLIAQGIHKGIEQYKKRQSRIAVGTAFCVISFPVNSRCHCNAKCRNNSPPRLK